MTLTPLEHVQMDNDGRQQAGPKAGWHSTTRGKEHPKRASCSCPALPHLLPGPAAPCPALLPQPAHSIPCSALPIPCPSLSSSSSPTLSIPCPSPPLSSPRAGSCPRYRRTAPYRTGAPLLATHQHERASHRLRNALPQLGGRARLAEPLRELPHFRHGDMVRADPSRAGPRRGLLPPSAGRGRAGRSR